MLCLYFSCSTSTCSPFPPLFTLISMLPIGNLADLCEYIKAKSRRIKIIYCKTFHIRMVFKWTYKWKGCSLFQVFHTLCCLFLGWKSSSNLLTALDWGSVNDAHWTLRVLFFLCMEALFRFSAWILFSGLYPFILLLSSSCQHFFFLLWYFLHVVFKEMVLQKDM